MNTSSEKAVATTYEVLVRGSLSDNLVVELGARLFEPRKGRSLLIVDVIDQSHLHGILNSLQDHNLEIERVNPI